MADKYNKQETEAEKLQKIDDFFSQFDQLKVGGKSNAENVLAKFDAMDRQEQAEMAEIHARRQTRMDRLNEKKSKKRRRDEDFMADSNPHQGYETHFPGEGDKKPKFKLPKGGITIKKVLLVLLLAGLVFGCVLAGITISVIKDAPDIDPSNLYALLKESSTLYDDEGNVLDNLNSFSSEGSRSNVEYKDLPKDLVNSFVALEDKTFWDHHGFNVVRIFGAIKDSFSSGRIGGTSTITQQLARNLYLSESKQERTLTRKITEAYYTVLLEKHLTKEEIIEAYLNTIYFGADAYGVQAASQAYFSKDVGDLDLVECAALASLPQAPNSYAWIKRYYPDDVSNIDADNILLKGNEFYYVYNTAGENRRQTCLSLMLEQGYINQSQYDEARGEDFKSHLSPNLGSTNEISSYFADYVVNQVRDSLVNEGKLSEDEANRMIYTGGLQIYTTMNSGIQKIAETEFSNNANFPSVAHLNKDGAGNIINDSGAVMLYDYHSYFDDADRFVLNADEYIRGESGSLTVKRGGRLNIYKVNTGGETDYNLEFKDIYVVEDGVFYSINGGVVSIPKGFKSLDRDGNLIISADYFREYPKAFEFGAGNVKINPKYYTLRQKVVQPQSAIVISDPHNGAIKAMVGGRKTVGRLLYNRAISPRQPGSSIKPIGVYGPALQASVDALNSGTTMKFSDSAGVSQLFGDYFTAASVIDDTPLMVQGKQWPKNWYSGYRGLYTFRTSIEQSVNVNAVRIFQQLGVHKSLAFLKSLGITSIVEGGQANDLNAAALSLGGMTKGISPLEMSAAYGAFVNDGKYSEPVAFTKVTNKKGEVILENEYQSKQVMDPGVAFIMRDMLRSVVTAGLGSKASIPNQPVAGKTGTTTDNYDAWFVGFTPQYSTAVWIGNDVNIELSQGSAAAAGLWSKIMSQVCANVPTGQYNPAPSNVISVAIDTKSGKLPSELSSADPRGTVRSEYFIKGTEPKSTDHIHKYVTVCSDSGFLATPACTHTRQVFGVMRPYMVNPSVGDIGYEVPHYYCPIHNPDPGTYATNPNGNKAGGGTTPAAPANGGTNGGEPATPPEENGGSPAPQDDGNTDENGNSTIPDWLIPH